MIPSLAPCFAGPFDWYKDGLALAGDHESSIAARDLLDGACAEEILHRYAQAHPGADRRAVVSMWTQWHFGILIVPATAAILLLERELPLSLEHVKVALNEEGRTAAIILPDEGERWTGTRDRFSSLFGGHIEPLVEHFSETFRVSRRLLWTNAAAAFEWTLQQAEPLDPCPAAVSEGRAWLQRRADAEGRPNPMCGAVFHCGQGGEIQRRRKICCLRYLLPGFEDCGSLCPLPIGKRS